MGDEIVVDAPIGELKSVDSVINLLDDDDDSVDKPVDKPTKEKAKDNVTSYNKVNSKEE